MANQIGSILEDILERGRQVIIPGAPARDDELKGLFRQLKAFITESYPVQRCLSATVDWSIGIGRMSKIPWLAILDSRETTSTKRGVYCVLLFRQDMSGVYLTLAQGVTDPKELYGHDDGLDWVRRNSIDLRRWCGDLQDSGFHLDERIDLHTDSGLGKDYEASTIAYKLYAKGQIPSDTDLLRDLGAVLTAYEQYIDGKKQVRNKKAGSESPIPSHPSGGSPRSWVFQGNPSTFNTTAAVRELPEIHWLVDRYRDRIHPGDRVFLWESGPEAGVLAVTTVISKPTEMPRPSVQNRFWSEPDDGQPRMRVRLRVDRTLEPRLLRSELLRHEILAHAQIIKQPRGTNFALTPVESEALMAIIDGAPEDVKPIKDLSAVVNQFSAALQASHLVFGSRHMDRVRDFVVALATKRLAILTGLSGSGKTQIAIRFGEWLGHADQVTRSLVVPVRPDWTGPEPLLGYEDALQQRSVDGRPAWHVPPVLEFILRAASDPSHPYLLILDEMNLAPVERYFADVLSGMESDQHCIPNLRQEPQGVWRADPSRPKIPFPKNLLVVGTVNVDETTYMFSPKVLDRANTFEFRVGPDDLGTDLHKPVACKAGDPRYVKGFLAMAMDDEWQHHHAAPDQGPFMDYLRTLHSLLYEGGFEFGYRTFYEATRFLAMFHSAGGDHMATALDLLVMQKVLPRLHGTRPRLEPILCGLGRFCFELQYLPGTIAAGTATEFNPLEKDPDEAHLETSFDKVKRMTRSLRANQFASFTEY